MPHMLFAINHPSRKAAIYGELDDQGIVTFAIEVLPDSPVRGAELFRRMMSAFGDEAKAIHGTWRKGGGPSINIDKVNELVSSGMSLEDAVHHAWTVTQAKKMAFNKVTVLLVEGSPGAYTKVDVLIEK